MSYNEMKHIILNELVDLNLSSKEREAYANYIIEEMLSVSNEAGLKELMEFESVKEFELMLNNFILPKIRGIIESDNKKMESNIRNRKENRKRKYALQTGLVILGTTIGLIAFGHISDTIVKEAEQKSNLEENIDKTNADIQKQFINDVIENKKNSVLASSIDDKILFKLSSLLDDANKYEEQAYTYDMSDPKFMELIQKKNAKLKEAITYAADCGHVLGGPGYEKYVDAIYVGGEIYYPIDKGNFDDNTEVVSLNGQYYVKESSLEQYK